MNTEKDAVQPEESLPPVASEAEAAVEPASIEAVPELLARAQAAYEADDSAAVSGLCQAVLEQDPENSDAWMLLAKFGGWDAKLYRFDIDFAIDSAKHALELLPEGERAGQAADIYAARKRQIALILESEMMMPSYSAAKQLHGTMMEWKRLLAEIPCLSASLIEAEVHLCENLCLRSKLGIMPGDRLVYTAYSTLNNKETYGQSFRTALEGRLREERQRAQDAFAAALERVREIRAVQERRIADKLPAEAERILLDQDLEALEGELHLVPGFGDKALYDQQVEELEAQLAKLGPLKFFKRKELQSQIERQKAAIAELEATALQAAAPIQEAIDQTRTRLAHIGE